MKDDIFKMNQFIRPNDCGIDHRRSLYTYDRATDLL
jgi:hypothetical protein